MGIRQSAPHTTALITDDPAELQAGDIVVWLDGDFAEVEHVSGIDGDGHVQINFAGGMIKFLKPHFRTFFVVRPGSASESRTVVEYINNELGLLRTLGRIGA